MNFVVFFGFFGKADFPFLNFVSFVVVLVLVLILVLVLVLVLLVFFKNPIIACVYPGCVLEKHIKAPKWDLTICVAYPSFFRRPLDSGGNRILRNTFINSLRFY